VVAGGVLVAGNNGGSIYALNALTGKLLWSRDVGQQINGSGAIDLHAQGGALAFVPVAQIGSPQLLALSLKNGRVRWDTVLTRQSGGDVFGSPTFSNGTVYIGTSGPNNDNSTARGSVVALSETTGNISWQTFTVPPGHDGGAVWSTPAIDPSTGRLYVGTGNAYHQPARRHHRLDGGAERVNRDDPRALPGHSQRRVCGQQSSWAGRGLRGLTESDRRAERPGAGGRGAEERHLLGA
jgi:polyvinyl alcohol dehydrogenase (cytochrome)